MKLGAVLGLSERDPFWWKERGPVMKKDLEILGISSGETRSRKLVGYAEPCNLLKLLKLYYVLILFQCLPCSSSARLCLWCTQEGAEIRLERLLEHRVPPCQGWFLHMELCQHESMFIQFFFLKFPHPIVFSWITLWEIGNKVSRTGSFTPDLSYLSVGPGE